MVSACNRRCLGIRDGPGGDSGLPCSSDRNRRDPGSSRDQVGRPSGPRRCRADGANRAIPDRCRARSLPKAPAFLLVRKVGIPPRANPRRRGNASTQGNRSTGSVGTGQGSGRHGIRNPPERGRRSPWFPATARDRAALRLNESGMAVIGAIGIGDFPPHSGPAIE